MILCNSAYSYAQVYTVLQKPDTYAQVSVKPSTVATDSGTVFLRTFEQEARLVVINATLLSQNESLKTQLSNEKRSWFEDVKWFIAWACVGMLAWEAAR